MGSGFFLAELFFGQRCGMSPINHSSNLLLHRRSFRNMTFHIISFSYWCDIVSYILTLQFSSLWILWFMFDLYEASQAITWWTSWRNTEAQFKLMSSPSCNYQVSHLSLSPSLSLSLCVPVVHVVYQIYCQRIAVSVSYYSSESLRLLADNMT